MNDFANNMKIAWVSAVATMGSGFATALEWIPTDIGKLASLMGIILTIVLIYTHWRNGRAKHNVKMIEYEKIALEIKIMKAQEADRERLQEAADR